MLIWRGLGLVVLVVPFVVLLAAVVLVDAVFGAGTYTSAIGPVLGGSLLLSAGIVAWINRRIERRPVRRLVDQATGEEVILAEKHDFWFVPLRYWPWILVGGGVVAIVVNLP